MAPVLQTTRSSGKHTGQSKKFLCNLHKIGKDNQMTKTVRKMTMSEQRALFEILDGRSSHGEVLKSHGDGVYSYIGDWSDMKVAMLISPELPASVVAYRRVEAYGPLPEAGPNKVTLAHRIERLEETMCKIHMACSEAPTSKFQAKIQKAIEEGMPEVNNDQERL